MNMVRQVSTKRTLTTIAMALTFGQALACTNVSLRCTSADCQPLYTAPLDNQMKVAGEACTASPDSVGYPYKILFIVDVSGSTATSDPTDNRGPAVQTVAQSVFEQPRGILRHHLIRLAAQFARAGVYPGPQHPLAHHSPARPQSQPDKLTWTRWPRSRRSSRTMPCSRTKWNARAHATISSG